MGLDEESADLLAQARERITKLRFHATQLRFVPPAGLTSLAGAQVRVDLVQHAFRFGSTGFALAAEGGTDEDHALAQRYLALLNSATLPFYWGGYEPERGRDRSAALERTAAWCRQHGLARGGARLGPGPG